MAVGRVCGAGVLLHALPGPVDRFEKRQESVIPLSFWFFSIGGGLTLLTYALHRLDPVFILGEGAGIFIYSRNLYLIWRKQRRLTAADA